MKKLSIVVNSRETAVAPQGLRPCARLFANVGNFYRSSLSMIVNSLVLLASVGKVNKNEESAVEKKSALYYLLDYIVRTDTISEEPAIRILKMIDNRDFPMDYVGGNEPPLDYEEILEQEQAELEAL